VQIFEVGEHLGMPFFSLEYCPAGSLAGRLGGTPLPPRPAAALALELVGALEAAHACQVLHRDIKPANVLLAGEPGQPLEQCRAKLTDFGLARRQDVTLQTQSGAIVGTPSYMAPEQAAGRSGEMGPATDVYGLGALLYELLTGRPPFQGATSLETVLQVLEKEPVAPRLLQLALPRDLETVCLKCLQKEPARRYGSARELAEDLGRYLQGEP
jgi:serine/threonine-protein kinase